MEDVILDSYSFLFIKSLQNFSDEITSNFYQNTAEIPNLHGYGSYSQKPEKNPCMYIPTTLLQFSCYSAEIIWKITRMVVKMVNILHWHTGGLAKITIVKVLIFSIR